MDTRKYHESSEQKAQAPHADRMQEQTVPSMESSAEGMGNEGAGSRTHSILQMQRHHGNRYVQRALARHGEGEAEVTPALESSIEQARGGGQGLDSRTRVQMESAFGSDFSGVRIHTGADAHSLNRAVNAVAFTTGQDIFFRDGAYDPSNASGRELLAHELTHVVQQGGAAQVPGHARRFKVQRMCPECEKEKERNTFQAKLVVGAPDDQYEQEADQVAKDVVRSFPARIAAGTLHAEAVQRLCSCGAQSNAGGECKECRNAREEAVQRTHGSKPIAGTLQRQDEDDGNDIAVEQGPVAKPAAAPAVAPTCTPPPGIANSTCGAYLANSWWLPMAYVNNATCACTATPNVPTANCVRKFLQDRLAATPTWLKVAAAAQKPLEATNLPAYQLFVQSVLTPRIYSDHVDAYRSCCCPTGPAPYPDWIGVTLIPLQPCSLVGWFINNFGSCTGTPGSW